MNSKKVIGIIAVLAVAALVFVGAGAAMTAYTANEKIAETTSPVTYQLQDYAQIDFVAVNTVPTAAVATEQKVTTKSSRFSVISWLMDRASDLKAISYVYPFIKGNGQISVVDTSNEVATIEEPAVEADVAFNKVESYTVEAPVQKTAYKGNFVDDMNSNEGILFAKAGSYTNFVEEPKALLESLDQEQVLMEKKAEGADFLLSAECKKEQVKENNDGVARAIDSSRSSLPVNEFKQADNLLRNNSNEVTLKLRTSIEDSYMKTSDRKVAYSEKDAVNTVYRTVEKINDSQGFRAAFSSECLTSDNSRNMMNTGDNVARAINSSRGTSSFTSDYQLGKTTQQKVLTQLYSAEKVESATTSNEKKQTMLEL